MSLFRFTHISSNGFNASLGAVVFMLVVERACASRRRPHALLVVTSRRPRTLLLVAGSSHALLLINVGSARLSSLLSAAHLSSSPTASHARHRIEDVQ
jgi:hypothetical protein